MCTGRDLKAVKRKRSKALNQLMVKSGARERIDSAPVKVLA